jgi:hypothetical protein
MYREYYYFVTGLPTLSPEDTKLMMTPLMFLHSAKEHLDKPDYELLKLLFIPNDITNLINILIGKETWLDESTVEKEEWLELIAYLNEIGDANPAKPVLDKFDVPLYIINYLQGYLFVKELMPEHILFKDLFSLFYNNINDNGDRFIKDWFRFDSDLKNILIALNCRKHNQASQEQLIGTNDLTERLVKSSAGDFGIGKDYRYFDVLTRLNEQSDIIEKEKGLDALKWKWIDNETFFDYFTIPRILGYFIKLRMIYRWIHLSQAVGEKRFGQVLHDLETSFEFPEEFALNKR